MAKPIAACRLRRCGGGVPPTPSRLSGAGLVAYALTVKEGPEHPRDRLLLELASKKGTTTASGSLSMTLRVFPSSKRVRSVTLLLNGEDPNGNEVSIARSLKLPHS